MPSGGNQLHSELVRKLQREIREWADATQIAPELSHCAESYAKLYVEKWSKEWERKVLYRQGLTRPTLHTSGLDQETINYLVDKERNDLLPKMEAIILGIDNYGPGIWVVQNDDFSDESTIGFAAVGIGGNHAETQLRLAKQSRLTSSVETLWQVFFAKKRAEIAPNVGVKATDMFVVSLSQAIQYVQPAVFAEMERLYKSIERAEARAQGKARSTLGNLIHRISEQVAPEFPAGQQLAQPAPKVSEGIENGTKQGFGTGTGEAHSGNAASDATVAPKETSSSSSEEKEA